MFKKSEISETPVSGVNIIPIIDVTMVLLVILLIMSPIINLPNLPVDLPEALTRETKDENLTVSLGSDGRVSIDMQIVEWNQIGPALVKELRSREKDIVVIVRADKELPYGKVETLIRMVNRFIGNRGLAIATKQRTAVLAKQS